MVCEALGLVVFYCVTLFLGCLLAVRFAVLDSAVWGGFDCLPALFNCYCLLVDFVCTCYCCLV